MTTSAYIGYGSTIGYSTTQSAYSAIGQVVDIKGPPIGVGEAKVTNNGSPSGFHEFIPSLADAGTVTFNCIYVTGAVTALYGGIRTIYYWQILYPDTHSWVCQGFLKTLNPGDPLEDAQTIDVEIRFTGKPTYA